MPVPSGVICMWPSTAASIPSGWTRETALDARYLRGAATAADADLSTDLGNTTHIHTSPTHAPTQNSHNHHVSAQTHTPIEMSDTNPRDAVQGTHAHADDVSSVETATIDAMSITVDAASNDLSWVEVIFIKSDGSPTGIPSGAYALFQSDTLPTNWVRVHGDRYPKGAAASGNGGATGGSNTHTHTSPSHVHTSPSHTHTGTSANAPNTGGSINNSAAAGFAARTHNHTYDLNATAQDWNGVTTTIDSGDGQPPFAKLNLVRNDNGGADLPTSLIALWGGTHAGIPAGWSRITFMDGKFLKDANADGESGVTTGGGSQHLHTASSCDPTEAGGGHVHTLSVTGISATVTLTDAAEVGSLDRGALDTHTHTWDIGGTTATDHANPATVTIDNCTSEAAFPKHRLVIFIRFDTAAAAEKVPFTRTTLLSTVLGAWQQVAQIVRSKPSPIPPPEEKTPYVRGWLGTVLDSWRPPPAVRESRPRIIVSVDNPPPLRPRLLSILASWLEPHQAAQGPRPRVTVSVDDPPPSLRSRVLLALESWAAPAPTAQPIRRVPQEVVVEQVLAARRWLFAVLDRWLPAFQPADRRRRSTEGTPPPIPPTPSPERVCYPREVGVGTGFSRVSASAVSYSRESVASSFTRQGPAAFSGTRLPPANQGFDRLEPPDCVTGLGYGDDYGFNYGGGS